MPRGIGLSLGLACDGNVSGSGPAPPVNTALPVITGTATEGQTLTASTGTWTGSPTYSYQWKRAGAAIDGATASTYLLVSADVGSTITVTVTATNAGGNTGATSVATATVGPAPPVNTVLPAITGTATEGQTLTGSTGTWTGSPTYAYQWKRAGVAIDGATASTYLLVSADVGSTITVTVTATNAGGSASATSAATATVASMYLLRDTFTDANGTALASHTMDVGGGWTGLKGTFDIQSNQGRCKTLAGGLGMISADAGRADYTAQCDVTPKSGSDPGLMIRGSDNNNCWEVDVYETGNIIQLYEYNSGAFTRRAFTAVTITPGTTYRLVVTCAGATITGTVDGGHQVQYASATFNQTATLCGLWEGNSTVNGTYDDFQVTP